jgi:(4S)-4-hydroxy-5-phosphonooxypentane-2,3-dione isomerase
MWIVHVHVRVKQEHIEAFRQATIENARHSVEEPGIARFDVLQQSDDPSRFVLVEVYRSQEDNPKHRDTAHYKAWAEAVAPMMAEPRSRQIYDNVFPADGQW